MAVTFEYSKYYISSFFNSLIIQMQLSYKNFNTICHISLKSKNDAQGMRKQLMPRTYTPRKLLVIRGI